ncbi:NUP37 family WD repeat protein [Schizosaccharomyces cryophilus OY26]|uniref:NUP37 family WD repeat protein n=1 Tax=Schizosaccharomyces cryophilus (strain OY26 / ATCC MYA-4695 / CBS 11777 / NBRC 106824 / NRRL Y48691) TaxID=653667 RepID=S9VXZ0_SCHCR|nr:NUP37 family WD repeat protein [Schizosaccharomyces cryophilus OY26]EPY52468.1 NUP37 family WD repeat protein [Schizosaccharomyces cryophilus OY26]
MTSSSNSLELTLENRPFTAKWCPASSSCSNLLAIGHDTGITVYKATEFANGEPSMKDLVKLYTIHIGLPVLQLAFSANCICSENEKEEKPQQDIQMEGLLENNILDNYTLCFACACEDNTVRLIIARNDSIITQHVLGGKSGHHSFVNAIDIVDVYSADNKLAEQVIASVGDDNTLIIWRLTDNGPVLAGYSLSSPGISVEFHPVNPNHLLVGEKSGNVRVFDWTSPPNNTDESMGQDVSEQVSSITPWLYTLNVSQVVHSYRNAGLASTLANARWVGPDGTSILVVCKSGAWLRWDLFAKAGNGSYDMEEDVGYPQPRTLLPDHQGASLFPTFCGACPHPRYPDYFMTASSQRQGTLQLINVAEKGSSPNPVQLDGLIVGMDWHRNGNYVAVITDSSLYITKVMG